ncbi:MAG: hypothetical protein LBJ70_03760 [Holosporales bacterium]|jgi:hypothetical protein|nr:hypothetical protein [Holosporales bacterium]
MMAQVQRIFGAVSGPGDFGVPQASLVVSERIQSLGLGDFDALQVSLASPEWFCPLGLKGEARQRHLQSPSAEGSFAHLASDNA